MTHDDTCTKTKHDPNMNIINIHKLSWPRVLCTSSAWKRPKRLAAASITLLPSGAHARRRGNAPEGQEVSICSSLVWKMHRHGGGKRKCCHSVIPELARNETYVYNIYIYAYVQYNKIKYCEYLVLC